MASLVSIVMPEPRRLRLSNPLAGDGVGLPVAGGRDAWATPTGIGYRSGVPAGAGTELGSGLRQSEQPALDATLNVRRSSEA